MGGIGEAASRPGVCRATALSDRNRAGERPLIAAGRKLPRAVQPSYRRATILASVAWFIQDLAPMGSASSRRRCSRDDRSTSNAGAQPGPVLITRHPRRQGSGLYASLRAARRRLRRLAADRLAGRIRCRSWALSDARGRVAASPPSRSTHTGATRGILLFGGFMLFNFMTEFRPERADLPVGWRAVPTRIRGKGAGFAAAFARWVRCRRAFLFRSCWPISHQAPAVRPRRHLAARRAGDLPVRIETTGPSRKAWDGKAGN